MVNTLLRLGPSSQGKYQPGVLGHGQRAKLLFTDKEQLSREGRCGAIKSLTTEIWEKEGRP